MNIGKSLARELLILVIGQAAILVLVYSMLLPEYFESGLRESLGLALEIEAVAYERELVENPKAKLPKSASFRSYLGIENLPPKILKIFPLSEHENRVALNGEEDHEGHFDSGHYGDHEDSEFLFFPYLMADGRTLYLVQELTEESFNNRFSYAGVALLRAFVFVIGGGFLLMWVLTTLWLLRKISRRVAGLSNWIDRLDIESDRYSRPDFQYEEFNHIASQFQIALGRIRDVLAREQTFLRNASHELRTPISIVRTNVELLERQEKFASEESVSRIRRAAMNMQQITETLLWLSREEDKGRETEAVDLDALVSELCVENHYLLNEGEVTVNIKSSGATYYLPLVACRIVINNLIRNAYQYTDQGKIDIELTERSFIISNTDATESTLGRSKGHGLGLLLVEKFAVRLGWLCQIEDISGGKRAEVHFFKD